MRKISRTALVLLGSVWFVGCAEHPQDGPASELTAPLTHVDRQATQRLNL